MISPPDTYSTAMTVVADESLAYVTIRRADDENGEFGVHAFGLDAAELAENVADLLRVWHGDHRDGPGPQFCVYPAGTPEDQLPEGCVIDKMHSWVTMSWPQAMIIPSRSQRPVGTTPTTGHHLENQS